MLTDEDVYFEMWFPKMRLQIPISSINKIETPRVYLGKSIGVRLLKVVFTNEKDKTDSAAWAVKNLAAWKEAVENLIQKSKYK